MDDCIGPSHGRFTMCRHWSNLSNLSESHMLCLRNCLTISFSDIENCHDDCFTSVNAFALATKDYSGYGCRQRESGPTFVFFMALYLGHTLDL